MSSTNKIAQAHSDDIFARLRPMFYVMFDWLTIEPIWRSYRFAGRKAATAVGFGLFFVWAIIIMIPLLIIGAFFAFPGIFPEDTVLDWIAWLSIIGAVAMTAYGGYRAWSLLNDRKTVYEYSQNPNIDGVVDSFRYLDKDDHLTRALAADAIATGMENVPRKVTKQLSMQPSEIVFEIADLLHDDSVGVRQSGSETLGYLSEEYPEEVAKYRDDVYSGITYPDSVVQSNCALIAGELAYYEPALIEEVVEHVAIVVDDPDPTVRRYVAVALGQIHSNKARELLQKLQNDSDADVRKHANEALQTHNQRTRTETKTRSGGSTV